MYKWENVRFENDENYDLDTALIEFEEVRYEARVVYQTESSVRWRVTKYLPEDQVNGVSVTPTPQSIDERKTRVLERISDEMVENFEAEEILKSQ